MFFAAWSFAALSFTALAAAACCANLAACACAALAAAAAAALAALAASALALSAFSSVISRFCSASSAALLWDLSMFPKSVILNEPLAGFSASLAFSSRCLMRHSPWAEQSLGHLRLETIPRSLGFFGCGGCDGVCWATSPALRSPLPPISVSFISTGSRAGEAQRGCCG